MEIIGTRFLINLVAATVNWCYYVPSYTNPASFGKGAA